MKFKKLLSIALATTLCFSVTAFAKTAETVQEVKVYTFEQVLEKVLKNDSDLALLEDNLELMDKQSETLAAQLGGALYPTDTTSYISYESYASLSQLNQLAVSKGTQRYTKEALTVSAEYSVMSMLSGINASETALSYADEEFEVYKQKYNMTSLKNKLGMISEVDVIQAKTTMDEYETKVTQAKLALENAYSSLAIAMNTTDKNFKVEYNVEYVPYKLAGDLNTKIAKLIKADPKLTGARLGLENLEKNKNVSIASSDTIYSYDTTMYNINQAAASVKSAEDSYTTILEATYKGLLNAEDAIKSLEANLEIAKKALTATEENFEAGRATKLDLDEAKLTVKKLENGIQSAKDGYMLAVFGFENPSTGISAGSSSSGSSQQEQ